MTVLTSMACIIDNNGITAPAFADVLATLQSQYMGIYGSDILLGNDTQDGQWLSLMATAINDCNAACVATFNAFSPSTAQGAGLSRVVKINGISRLVSSNSTCDIVIVGTVGLPIVNGVVSDQVNNWNLPALVEIPISGTITVTAVCAIPGAIAAAANTLTQIITATRGWNSANNPAAATLGAPVETDALLRARQSVSTAQPSMTIADGIIGGIRQLTGVVRLSLVINNSDLTDANGIPSHSFSAVVDGGDATAIANVIFLRKAPGAGTYGSTAVTVTSPAGIPEVIRFARPVAITITVQIDLLALAGYVTSVGVEIQTAVANYLNTLPIGAPIYWTRIMTAANLALGADNPDGGFFDITALRIARSPAAASVQNLTLAYNEAAACIAANVVLTVS